MVSSVVPVSPSTRHASRRQSFSSRSPLTRRARPPRETLPTGVLKVVKSVCVDLRVGPVRPRRRTSTSTRPDKSITPASSLEQALSCLSRTVSMEGLLQCGNCDQYFDLERRRPKLLPCGHTHCQDCVLASLRNSRAICPTDNQIVHVDVHHLQDDLQLICWLEATAQGLLECVCCGTPFDWLLRRPAALDCGHSVCRACLHEANGGGPAPLPLPRPLTRSASIDESWDYSQEDGYLGAGGGDTCSSVSSLSSDEGVALSVGVGELAVDCPIEGCLKGVRARDHLHLLSCLDDSAAPRNRAKKAIRCEDQLLEKLAQLEKQIASVYGDSGPARALVDPKAEQTESAAGQLWNDGDVGALLASVRRLIEHKDSIRIEPPTVLKQVLNVSNCALPDLLRTRPKEDLGIFSFKECQVELDVYDLSLCSPGEMRVKKEAVLRSDKKVWKLTGVDCWCDPEWTLRLLKRCAPYLEQLQLQYPGREHLEVVRDCMPLLRRLEVRGWRGLDLQQEPFRFDEGPGTARNSLEWLEVFLPTPTSLSLVRAHRGSLRRLRLVVADEWSTPRASSCEDLNLVSDVEEIAGQECEWPEEDGFAVVPCGEDCVEDIPTSRWDDLLRACGGDVVEPVALQAVSLLWLSPRPHDTWSCSRFARTLRDARPNIAVDCEVCRRTGAAASALDE